MAKEITLLLFYRKVSCGGGFIEHLSPPLFFPFSPFSSLLLLLVLVPSLSCPPHSIFFCSFFPTFFSVPSPVFRSPSLLSFSLPFPPLPFRPSPSFPSVRPSLPPSVLAPFPSVSYFLPFPSFYTSFLPPSVLPPSLPSCILIALSISFPSLTSPTP